MAGIAQSASIKVDGLACVRGGRLLFKGLSFGLAAGGAAIITGPNGIGKSSLLRLLAGLLEPFSGSFSFQGKLALADEKLALDPQQSLKSALSFWASIDGDGHVDEALIAFGLDHLADVPVRILSTGQRKRAVLARTLARGADIWLLDEPGNGLDTVSLDRLDTAMAAHRAKGGIILAASHQPLGLRDAHAIEIVAP
jgi:heme exporter protein A